MALINSKIKGRFICRKYNTKTDHYKIYYGIHSINPNTTLPPFWKKWKCLIVSKDTFTFSVSPLPNNTHEHLDPHFVQQCILKSKLKYKEDT